MKRESTAQKFKYDKRTLGCVSDRRTNEAESYINNESVKTATASKIPSTPPATQKLRRHEKIKNEESSIRYEDFFLL